MTSEVEHSVTPGNSVARPRSILLRVARATYAVAGVVFVASVGCCGRAMSLDALPLYPDGAPTAEAAARAQSASAWFDWGLALFAVAMLLLPMGFVFELGAKLRARLRRWEES